MTIDRGQLEDAARRLKRRELDKVELQARLQEQVRDRLYKEATQAAYLSNVEQAGVIRRSFAERLGAYKWVAAISTGAFFFLGQTLASTAQAFSVQSATAALVAEGGFLCSLAGAALYMFTIESRASAWHRTIFTRTGRVMSLLAGIDASTEERRSGLDQDDLKTANNVFWEMVASKFDLGRIMSAPMPTVPREGLLGGFVAALCVGGLVLGLLAASFYQWTVFIPQHQ